jgi:5-methylcytosine-specific restriction endonuclease McrA
MNLTSLSNESLLSRTRELAQEERRLTNELLHHLLEIEARKLYLDLGHPSLFVYVTRELHYSEASAQRRIDAARLLRQVPVLEEKLASGELTLGSVGKAQQYFRAEQKRGLKLSPEQKQEVVLSLSGLSTREAESKLALSNPDAFRQERVREVGGDELTITFTASKELRTQLERVRELHSHVDASLSYEGLFEMLADFYIAKKDRLKVKARSPSKGRSTPKVEPSDDSSLPQRRSGAPSANSQPAVSRLASRRALPRALEREVRQRDQNQCVWLLPGGKRCGSRWKLEIDHIDPYAMGGESTLENLRCLCREHNQFAAQKVFGREKMSEFRS